MSDDKVVALRPGATDTNKDADDAERRKANADTLREYANMVESGAVTNLACIVQHGDGFAIMFNGGSHAGVSLAQVLAMGAMRRLTGTAE